MIHYFSEKVKKADPHGCFFYKIILQFAIHLYPLHVLYREFSRFNLKRKFFDHFFLFGQKTSLAKEYMNKILLNQITKVSSCKVHHLDLYTQIHE